MVKKNGFLSDQQQTASVPTLTRHGKKEGASEEGRKNKKEINKVDILIRLPVLDGQVDGYMHGSFCSPPLFNFAFI